MSFHMRKVSMSWLRSMAQAELPDFDRAMRSEASIFAEDGSHDLWLRYRASGEAERARIHQELRDAKADSTP